MSRRRQRRQRPPRPLLKAAPTSPRAAQVVLVARARTLPTCLLAARLPDLYGRALADRFFDWVMR